MPGTAESLQVPGDVAQSLTRRGANILKRRRDPWHRDAAVTASVQRIMHYKIAGYGAIAAYARALGRAAEAAHFAQLADRDKAVDGELSELAKGTLNPDAVVAPQGPPGHEEPATTH